jgi:hypothetical protein
MSQTNPPAPVPPALPTQEEWDRIDATLFPHSLQQRRRVQAANGHFVHYTSGEGAEGILTKHCVWLRSTTCMNDYSEVLHGYDCLRKAWFSKSGQALRDALDKCHPDVVKEAVQDFDNSARAIANGSFVACFSEHDPAEDQHGRLSMWRAYCNPTGVALVLNSAPFFLKSNALKAYSSPVAYLADHQFAEIVYQIAVNVEKERDFLGALDRSLLRQILFNMFRFAILCTKHPAFAEEREWRVVYTPALLESAHIKRNVRTLRGVTQPVYDMPLKDIPDEGLVGIEIPQLVHKIIIGPTQYGSAAWNALWFLLEDAGIDRPGERLVASGVPLRT